MAIEAVRTVLVNTGAVTALVPASRIEPLRRTQSFEAPAITLQRISETPFGHLRSTSGLTTALVQLDVWDVDNQYTRARQIADACRAALEDADFAFVGESDGYESETDPEQCRITQSWSVFTS